MNIACEMQVYILHWHNLGISPPAAPPFTPKQGPKEGSLKATTAFLPILLSPMARPTLIVVFPSPAGVGFIAVTKINLPSFLAFSFSKTLRETFALYLP